jgi:hypothetical protein
VFGSDCVYYGSPQWQIETLWRFEIPEELREEFAYPELTKAAKRKILGLNSARLYKLPRADEASPHGVYRPVPADYADHIPTELSDVWRGSSLRFGGTGRSMTRPKCADRCRHAAPPRRASGGAD